jgi:acetyl esterase
MPVYDPDLARLLELGKQAGRPPFEALSPDQARKAYAGTWDILQPPAQEVAHVSDRTLPTNAGPLALRIYRGLDTQPDADLPCVLYMHGGGWVIGNLDSHDRLCRQLANQAGVCVVSVDYRLAPEHPFPAAIDDCADAWRWVYSHASELKIDAKRMGVAGDSAGGNLAAVLALMARDGDLPECQMQALIYPVTDLTASSAGYQRVTTGVPLTDRTMHYFIDHYTPRAEDRRHWRASPAFADSLAGLPKTLVLTVAHDPLCEEGREYARRLEAADVAVTSLHLADHMHGMLTHGKMVKAGVLMSGFVCQWIALALRQG